MTIKAIASWENKAAEKRASTLARIPPDWKLDQEDLNRAVTQRDLTGSFIQQFLDAKDIDIINTESEALVKDLAQGKLTALEVTTSFCKTAAVAHQINNCLHEIFFDEALERAAELDAYYTRHKRTCGPLHGLPVSLKDQFHVKGIDTTMGYVGWIGGNLGIEDPELTHRVESQVVTDLLGSGAVLYCKTSLPQTLLFGETKNNIIGQTLNPHNQNLSCGGSSGGEGALQALRGSSLGLGTDIGGSVRIPAAFCGIFSMKPSPERISYRNAANTNPGQDTYRSSVGLLSTSLGGIDLALRVLLDAKPWLRDPAVVPIPFRQDAVDDILDRADASGALKDARNGLKLGVLWTDGVVGIHPPISRGLHNVVDAVRQAGHEVVDWEPPSQTTAKRVHVSFLKADGGHDIHAQLDRSGEPLIPDLQEAFALRPPMDLLEYQDLTLQGLEYEAAYAEYWNDTAKQDGKIVDAVIMPVAPHAAVIPGKFYHTAYTEAMNLTNYSVVVIPVTKADKNVDVFDHDYEPLNEKDELNWKAYDADVYHGAPVGVQIVARKFEEEKVWAIAKLVHQALEKWSG